MKGFTPNLIKCIFLNKNIFICKENGITFQKKNVTNLEAGMNPPQNDEINQKILVVIHKNVTKQYLFKKKSVTATS